MHIEWFIVQIVSSIVLVSCFYVRYLKARNKFRENLTELQRLFELTKEARQEFMESKFRIDQTRDRMRKILEDQKQKDLEFMKEQVRRELEEMQKDLKAGNCGNDQEFRSNDSEFVKGYEARKLMLRKLCDSALNSSLRKPSENEPSD